MAKDKKANELIDTTAASITYLLDHLTANFAEHEAQTELVGIMRGRIESVLPEDSTDSSSSQGRDFDNNGDGG